MKPQGNAVDYKDLFGWPNSRKGEPLAGCDCVRCFGYCMIDQDRKAREAAEQLYAIRNQMELF